MKTLILLAVLSSTPAIADDAREVLLHRCGGCHDGASSSAKPKALAIFDASKPDPLGPMTERHLRDLTGRMGFFTPRKDKETVSKAVEAELSRRAAPH